MSKAPLGLRTPPPLSPVQCFRDVGNDPSTVSTSIPSSARLHQPLNMLLEDPEVVMENDIFSGGIGHLEGEADAMDRQASDASSFAATPPRERSSSSSKIPGQGGGWKSWFTSASSSRPPAVKPAPQHRYTTAQPASKDQEPENGRLDLEQLDDWVKSRSRFSSFGHEDQELRWEKLSMTVNVRRREHKRRPRLPILKNVSGAAKSGHLTCILGPSGSGKTTLLNVLAGRQSGGLKHGTQITGQVWAAGQRIDPRAVRSRIAYVMQKDEMFATATPREALQFSAALRNVGQREDLSELILELLGSLGLLKCADTFIGNAVINGLSGGQRKRTAIGVELITRPDIVCLDEPTSGLDSYAAYQVVRVLKDLAQAGCTVICTLHQPSSEIFALVDHVICLCNGGCFFEGSRDQMVQYFSKVGYRCPDKFNPADFAIFLMQKEPREKLDQIIDRWSKERHQSADKSYMGCSSVGSMKSELCATPHGKAEWLTTENQMLPSATKSFSKQLSELTRRELRAAVRDRTTMTVRFCLSVVLTMLFGMVFRGVGRTVLEPGRAQSAFDLLWTGLTEDEVRALRKQKLEWHFNALVQVAIVAMFSATQPVILTFPLERAVFLREHSSGTYGVLPYYLSKMAVEVPLVFIQSLVTLGLCYVIMCLNGDFLSLLLTTVLLSVCSVAVALAIGCAVRQPRETGAVGPLIFVPQMLFSGVFIPVAHIPPYLRWMQYFSFLQYAIKVLGIIEFRTVPDKDILLASQDIVEDKLYVYVGLLILLIFIFSLSGIGMLRRKAQHLF